MEVVSRSDRDATEALEGVHLAQLAAGEEMSVQYFEIEPGAVVDEHDHHHEQLGYLMGGSVTFIAAGEEFDIEPGDSYVIPGDESHAAENRGNDTAVGIEIFSPPRPNPPWTE